MANSKKNGHDVSEWEEIFDTINDAITIHDTEFNIIKANKAAEALLGVHAKDLFKNKCFVSYHGTERAPQGCPSCNVLKTEVACVSEVYEPHVRKFVEIKAIPRFDENKKLIGLVHIARDISARKKAEKQIADLAKFPEENPNPVLRVAEDGALLYANNGAQAFLSIWDNEHKHCVDKEINDLIQMAKASGKVHTITRQIKGKFFLLNFAPISGKTYINIYGQDVTEQKKAEKNILEAKEKAEKYLNIAGVMILGINLQKQVIVVNKKGAEILGYEIDEIIGQNFFTKFVPQRMQAEILEVSDKLFSGEIEPVEYYENPIVNKQGQERMIAWHNTILKNEIGEVIAHLSSGEDITERKKADNELKERVRELEIFHNATIGRELAMRALKERIKKLEAAQGAK